MKQFSLVNHSISELQNPVAREQELLSTINLLDMMFLKDHTSDISSVADYIPDSDLNLELL